VSGRPPLDGLRILDLSRVLAGPYCTMMLGDLGADVVKVELPGLGDDTRRWGPPFKGGESTYYLGVNRNKRSLTLNLKHERGRELLRRLAAGADVLVENFRPGTLEALGLGYEQLRETSPRLVYCAISAFGPRGPARERPGYDFAIQAMGGIMSVTGEPEGEPMKVGVAIVDVTAGLYALGAILAALRARDRDGLGQRVEVSLFQSQLAWLVNVASAYLVAGEAPGRHGNAHASIVPYQSFKTADDWIAIAAGNDGQFRALARALGLEALADDPDYATNPARVEHRRALVARLAEAIGRWPAADLLGALEAAGVPCAPINTLERVFADPQVAALGAVIHARHPTVGDLPMVRWPFELSETPGVLRRPPPLLGEHSEELLGELGLTAEEVERLRAEGAV
jgi:formyl-CoA transferase